MMEFVIDYKGFPISIVIHDYVEGGAESESDPGAPEEFEFEITDAADYLEVFAADVEDLYDEIYFKVLDAYKREMEVFYFDD